MEVLYGIKALLLNYGQTVLFPAHLGGRDDGKFPVQYMRVLFGKPPFSLPRRMHSSDISPLEEERLPHKEGWRKTDNPVTATDIDRLAYKMMMANEHKMDEVSITGVGTLHAAATNVSGMLGDYCDVVTQSPRHDL